MNKDFEKWWKELNELAESNGMDWLISPDKESYRESFEDGLSPEDELIEQQSAACS